MRVSGGGRIANGRHGRCGGHVLAGLLAVALFSSCRDDDEHGDDLTSPVFNPVVPLAVTEVECVLRAAARAVDDPHLAVAVVDRIGNILAVWRRNPATPASDLNKTVSVARATAFLSSSQGPLSSRTLEYISTFHFPPTFGPPAPLAFATLPAQRVTTGVRDTAQGPLWQIFTSNRGAPFAGPGLTVAETGVETLFEPGKDLPPATNIDGSAPSPGLSYLPGGIPLYKNGRVVGGVGCYSVDPAAPAALPNVGVMEFAALEGAKTTGEPCGPFNFEPIPDEGAIFLVGKLLPYVRQSTRPQGVGPGAFDPAGVVVAPSAGDTDPFGWQIGPRADPLGNLSEADVRRIVQQGIDGANGTRAAIRLPLGTTTKMIFGICNLDGLILGAFRMEDAPIFSFDVSLTKSRAVVYFSGTSVHPDDRTAGVPLGTAVTTRTLGFLTQPFYPPTIDGGPPGPLFQSVAVKNQDPAQYNRLGNAPFRAGLQSGIIFFPGAAPLYDPLGQLIGGLGVSGDGVEQDDFVTARAVEGFEPPPQVRADNFKVNGARLPYFKFPQLPGPGSVLPPRSPQGED